MSFSFWIIGCVDTVQKKFTTVFNEYAVDYETYTC
jgi:hypothetical protein